MGDAYQGVLCRFYVVEEPVLPGVWEVINVLAGLDVKPSSERRPCMPMESRKRNVFKPVALVLCVGTDGGDFRWVRRVDT